MTRSGISILLFLQLVGILAHGQAASARDDYLLRLERETLFSNTCVLLQKTGAFHLESGDPDNTRVIEGSLNPSQVEQVVNNLKSLLTAVAGKHLEDPLIRHHDLLTLDISQNDLWYEVKFSSLESQEPYRESLQPLIHLLNDLRKLPHRELTEDAGRNNCLPPGKIELKKRTEQMPPSSAVSAASGATPSPEQTLTAPSSAKLPQTLLRVESFGMKSNVFHQSCVLIVEGGTYRAEERSQKTGSKKVETKLSGGQLTPIEISQLQELLADPTLAKIRHRATSHSVQPVSGEMLELEIPRPSGIQELVLSSTFNRPGIPFFYSGDGDIASARPLLKFLSEHVENSGLGSLDPQQRNDCQSAP